MNCLLNCVNERDLHRSIVACAVSVPARPQLPLGVAVGVPSRVPRLQVDRSSDPTSQWDCARSQCAEDEVNSRSVMLLNVLGYTRDTLMWKTS